MTKHLDILAAIDCADVLSDGRVPLTLGATVGNPLRDESSASSPAEGPSKVQKREVEKDEPADSTAKHARLLGYSAEAMNKRHALVLIGSKALILTEDPTAPPRQRIVFHTTETFHLWYQNRPTEMYDSYGNVKATTWSGRWIRDRDRRQYSGVTFFPNPDGMPAQPGYYNFWRGFAVEPKAGGSYSIFRDHLFTNVCSGRADWFEWLFAYIAHMCQRPRERLGVALVLRGKQGVGKTKLGEVIGRLFPSHALIVDDPRYIVGTFNAHMAQLLLLCADEAVWAGSKEAAGRMKGLITSIENTIEHKGIDAVPVPNYIHLILTSNEGWVIDADMDDRRYAIFDVPPNVKENIEYFAEMEEQLAKGGIEALLFDLLNVDLSKFDLRRAPKTSALLEQKIRSLSPVASFWFERLHEGTTRANVNRWEEEVDRTSLFDEFVEKAGRIGIKRRASESEVGMELRKLVPTLKEARRTVYGEVGSHRARVYRFPPLAECRAAFEAAIGHEIHWELDAG